MTASAHHHDITRSPVAGAACALLLAVSMDAREPATAPGPAAPAAASLAPASMPRVGTVDERYQSYNVEMLEVVGGNFWKPYGPELEGALATPARAAAAPDGSHTPSGMDARLYQYLPPMDLAHPRLRRLAAALGPAYVRVSGTWANTTYFADSDERPAQPPPGFNGVLTRSQWKGVLDFARAANAEIVTSFATGTGTRDASGAWTPDLARRWVAYTRAAGGRIAAAEFMNEPTLAVMGGAPRGYDAAAYGRDFQRFLAFAREAAPDMLILHPGAVGESTTGQGVAQSYGTMPVLGTRDLLAASRGHADAFSYHHYGAASRRCAAMGPDAQTTASEALSEEWLRRTDETLAFYRRLRDEFLRGKPFWNTETADAACGGNPWASSFLDTFRYLDQLGRLARQDVRVVAHNTLAASDYALVEPGTFSPRPSYWGALLWRRLMGTTVLDSGVPIAQGLHVYAHCLRGQPGGVAVLAINNDLAVPRSLRIPSPGERYALSAPSRDLQTKTVFLNGAELALGQDDALPGLAPVPQPAGIVSLAPATITFIALPQAGNGQCR